jgi:hypothetical protein
VGAFMAIFSLLSISGLAYNILPFVPNYIQLFIGFILIATGYYNLNAGAEGSITPSKD